VSVGYIYILSNSAMPGLLKIGYTTKDQVKERAQELSAATGVPEPFQIEYYCLTRNVEEVENKTHQYFSSHRVKGKEFFNLDAQEAVKFVDTLVQDVKPDRFCRITLQPVSQQRWLRCRTCNHEWSIPRDSVDSHCPKCGWHISDRLREGPSKDSRPTAGPMVSPHSKPSC